MKGRESGMPDEAYWQSFFDAERASARLLGADRLDGDVVEFGCGYGTFSLPVAQRTSGKLFALDIEAGMIAALQDKAVAAGVANLRAQIRDFVAEGTGLDTGSQAHAMIYNLLHLENPVSLLREAHRVLREGSGLSVMHWRSDIPTPRGPSLAIRPRPEQCIVWMQEAGFHAIAQVSLEGCCPFHFGLVGYR